MKSDAVSNAINTTSYATRYALSQIGEVELGQNFGDEWLLMSVQGTSPFPISHQSYIAKEPCQLLVILQESFNAHCAHVSR